MMSLVSLEKRVPATAVGENARRACGRVAWRRLTRDGSAARYALTSLNILCFQLDSCGAMRASLLKASGVRSLSTGVVAIVVTTAMITSIVKSDGEMTHKWRDDAQVKPRHSRRSAP
jgi:hypothetical protein